MITHAQLEQHVKWVLGDTQPWGLTLPGLLATLRQRTNLPETDIEKIDSEFLLAMPTVQRTKALELPTYSLRKL